MPAVESRRLAFLVIQGVMMIDDRPGSYVKQS